MIKYVTTINTPKIVLEIMGRKRTFLKGEETTSDIYTTTYPKYFKRIGEIKGSCGHLNTPFFVPDSIEDFITKEQSRQRKSKKVRKVQEVKELEELSSNFARPKIHTEED